MDALKASVKPKESIMLMLNAYKAARIFENLMIKIYAIALSKKV
jgi:hypothetical protein